MRYDTSPSVSVLIPTYKRAQTLHYVLHGLENQTHKNFEIMLILKPSGDGTEELLKKYQNSGQLDIKLIFQKKLPEYNWTKELRGYRYNWRIEISACLNALLKCVCFSR